MEEGRIYERVIYHCVTCPYCNCSRIKGKRYSASLCRVLKKYICNNSTDIPTLEQERKLYLIPYAFLPDCPLKKVEHEN